MQRENIKHIFWTVALPLFLIVVFEVLKSDQMLMEHWVWQWMRPLEQALGRFFASAPFSVAELIAAAAGIWLLLWLLRLLDLLRKAEWRQLYRHAASLLAVVLWLYAALCWMWNAAYYAKSFAQRSGMRYETYGPAELFLTTVYFAEQAAARSAQVKRDAGLHFAEEQAQYFENGIRVYDRLSEEYPCLAMPSVCTKPMYLWSRLQSRLGFTGVYFPFTGEANVNIDAPACLRPAVIAHEMAHQRMVASEQEANFVGILAAIRSDDVVFQYSGYLMGLMELSNALNQLSPELWNRLAQAYFTPELSQDWNDNHAYWKALESPAEEAAGAVYDSYLKGNGQTLGILSYGACVDLLVSHTMQQLPEAEEALAGGDVLTAAPGSDRVTQ